MSPGDSVYVVHQHLPSMKAMSGKTEKTWDRHHRKQGKTKQWIETKRQKHVKLLFCEYGFYFGRVKKEI